MTGTGPWTALVAVLVTGQGSCRGELQGLLVVGRSSGKSQRENRREQTHTANGILCYLWFSQSISITEEFISSKWNDGWATLELQLYSSQVYWEPRMEYKSVLGKWLEPRYCVNIK